MENIDTRQRVFDNAIDKLVKQIPDGLNDIEKARYVYLNLGKLLCYDEKYWYGNSEIKNRIYRRSMFSAPKFSEIQENKKKKVICVSISKLYSSVLHLVGIKSGQQNEIDHVYNYMTINNNLYFADLNNDLKYIQLNLPTKHFFVRGENVLSKEDLQSIDEKIVYFYDGEKNFENVIGLIRSKIQMMDKLSDKMQCIFDLAPTIPGVKDLELIERNSIYNYLALNTLNNKEFLRERSIELYETQIDNKKRKNRVNYQTVYFTQDYNHETKKTDFSYFLFSKKEKKFKKVSPSELLDFIEKNNLDFQKIPGIISNAGLVSGKRIPQINTKQVHLINDTSLANGKSSNAVKDNYKEK